MSSAELRKTESFTVWREISLMWFTSPAITQTSPPPQTRENNAPSLKFFDTLRDFKSLKKVVFAALGRPRIPPMGLTGAR